MSWKRCVVVLVGVAALGIDSDAAADDRRRGGRIEVASYSCGGSAGRVTWSISFGGSSFATRVIGGLGVSADVPVMAEGDPAELCQVLTEDMSALLERRGCTVGGPLAPQFGFGFGTFNQLQAVCRGTRSRLIDTMDAAMTRVLTGP